MPANVHSEAELAQALIEGKAEAFDTFVEHFRTKVFQYSYLMCGQREDAEEVAQDTLLKVFESFSTLREPERVRSWVFRIAKNACLMKRRRSVFAPDHELSLEAWTDGDSYTREIPSPETAPDVELYRLEMNAALARGIRALPPNYRSVILLRDIEELSTEETAEILDVSTDVVKQRLHRARLALRKEVEKSLAAGCETDCENDSRPDPLPPEKRQKLSDAFRVGIENKPVPLSTKPSSR